MLPEAMDVTATAAAGMQAAMRDAGAYAADVVAEGLTTASLPQPPAVIPPVPNLVQGVIATPQDGLVGSMVGMMLAANRFRANLAVYRTASGMFQRLLDTIA